VRVSARPDPDKVFETRTEAEAALDRLNQQLPEWGYSPWYLGQGAEGEWWVIRARQVIAEDLDQGVRVYEEAFRDHVERSALQHDSWRDLEGIRIEEVSLAGTYPDTRLVKVFRAATSRKTRFGQPTADCRFGVRWRIWPAESVNPETEAAFHDIYFSEFLGTNPRAYRRLRGADPCDPDQINWLE
jgi:hypothetical protein